MATRCCHSMAILVSLSFLLVALGECQGQTSCKVKPSKYSYKSTTTHAVQTGCSMSATRPSYVDCTGNTLPLNDDDLGPNCDTTDQQGRFYIWEHSRETTRSLLLSFDQTISPTHIRLHYFSDPVNRTGLPSIRFYADIGNPWDTPTGTDVRIANVRAMLKDESEPPRREIHDITLNPASLQLDTLLLQIRFFDGNAVSSFYLSEVEVFTCSPDPTPVTRCFTSETEDTVSTVTTVPIGEEYTSQPTDPVTPTSTVKGTNEVLSSTPGQIENPNGMQSSTSGSSSAIFAAVGGVVAVFIIIIIASGLVAVIMYCRRKKGKQKGGKVIQHIGEDESNVYALVNKPRRTGTAPAVPPQNFDLVEEDLDRETSALSDPSTGQTSAYPHICAKDECFDHVGSSDFQGHVPPPHTLTKPSSNAYEILDDPPKDPYYSIPVSKSSGPQLATRADGGNTYDDTVSAASQRGLQSGLAAGKDNISVDTDMYSIVN